MSVSTETKALVIAGIVDTRDGSIIETTTNPKEKRDIRLRTRDMNLTLKGDSRYIPTVFISFEFGTVGPNSLAYLERNLQVDTKVLRPIRIWQAEFRIHDTQQRIARAEAGLAEREEAIDKCLNPFDDASPHREFIEDALRDALDEERHEVESLRNHMTSLKNHLTVLQKAGN